MTSAGPPRWRLNEKPRQTARGASGPLLTSVADASCNVRVSGTLRSAVHLLIVIMALPEGCAIASALS
jgi:hypothetical protein